MRSKPTEQELAAAVELNQAESLRVHSHLPWVEFNDDGDVLRSFAGDTWPRNTVAWARFTPANAPRRIKDILARHLREKVACNWVVGPVSEPADLGKHLRAQGFHCMIHCAGMVCDLSSLPPAPLVADGFRIRELDEPARLRPLTTDRRRDLHRGLTLVTQLKPRQVWLFTASHGDQHIGATALLMGAGVAGIYGVEVLKEFRRQGIGSALVHAALEKARGLGLSFAVLGASGMGRGVYERLGFREVCKLSFWKFGKMRQLRT
jgi:GNAT superfamily N-acetyltransferase